MHSFPCIYWLTHMKCDGLLKTHSNLQAHQKSSCKCWRMQRFLCTRKTLKTLTGPLDMLGNQPTVLEDVEVVWDESSGFLEQGWLFFKLVRSQFFYFAIHAILIQNAYPFKHNSLYSMERTLLKAWDVGNGRAHYQEFLEMLHASIKAKSGHFNCNVWHCVFAWHVIAFQMLCKIFLSTNWTVLTWIDPCKASFCAVPHGDPYMFLFFCVDPYIFLVRCQPSPTAWSTSTFFFCIRCSQGTGSCKYG